jgi:hypothetical protein
MRPNVSAGARPRAPRDGHIVPPFDGYPYLVTRIGRTPLRHFAIVPGDWDRDRLIELARRQAIANKLETCLCLGPNDAVLVSPEGEARAETFVPSGIPVVDCLVVSGPPPDTAEQAARRKALSGYARRWKGRGYLVGDGLEGGRPAKPDDVARLAGKGPAGLPPGLRRCRVCGQPRGEYLSLRGFVDGLAYDERSPRVVEVHCRCDNHNRCAGCGEPLAGQRLSAYYWDEDRASVLYVAAYCGLSHRCA